MTKEKILEEFDTHAFVLKSGVIDNEVEFKEWLSQALDTVRKETIEEVLDLIDKGEAEKLRESLKDALE